MPLSMPPRGSTKSQKVAGISGKKSAESGNEKSGTVVNPRRSPGRPRKDGTPARAKTWSNKMNWANLLNWFIAGVGFACGNWVLNKILGGGK